jgi:hypothetical protein
MNLGNVSQFYSTLEKKMTNFLLHAPAYLSMEIDVSLITIKNIKTGDELRFPLNADKNVSDVIREIHLNLRKSMYPKIVCCATKTIEPEADDILNLAESEGISTDIAYKKLSQMSKKVVLTIDKVDLKKNKISVISSDKDTYSLYKVSIPVIVFLNMIRKTTDEDKKRDIFFEYATEIERK